MYDAMIERETLANYLEGLAKRCGQLHKFSTPAQRLEHIATIRRAMDILSRDFPEEAKLIATIRRVCDQQEALARL